MLKDLRSCAEENERSPQSNRETVWKTVLAMAGFPNTVDELLDKTYEDEFITSRLVKYRLYKCERIGWTVIHFSYAVLYPDNKTWANLY
jgi:hypothetical protein